jgi:hypothetical protein
LRSFARALKPNAQIEVTGRNSVMHIRCYTKMGSYVTSQRYSTQLKKVKLYSKMTSVAFPYLWVNGEKYVFSKEVIDAGRNLFNNFCKILY